VRGRDGKQTRNFRTPYAFWLHKFLEVLLKK
jgi:hypothetical protein